MGGPGSGNFDQWRRRPRKATVGDCLSLSTSFLTRQRYLAVGVYSTGSVRWGTQPEAPWVSFAVDTLDDDRPFLTLTYRVGKDPTSPWLDYRVPLVTTRPRFGGVRWWFRCPLAGCGRRAAALHLPPGGRSFGCRGCYRLTYASCQDSHRFDTAYRHIAAAIGVDPADVKWALGRSGSCRGA